MIAVAKASNTGAVRFVGGQPAELDLSGALYLPQQQALIVSDMHLEKGTSWARRGFLLPPYDSRKTVTALEVTVRAYRPQNLIFLGDSFHDLGGHERLDKETAERLFLISRQQETFWITGNHDPELPDGLPGHRCAELAVGGIRLVHIPQGPVSGLGEISGHLHPAATVHGRGRSVKRRCFATDGQRMILPAFGAYTGGLNILDEAFKGLFNKGDLVAYVIGEDAIYPMALAARS